MVKGCCKDAFEDAMTLSSLAVVRQDWQQPSLAREQGMERILILERDRELGGILNQCIHNGFGLPYFS